MAMLTLTPHYPGMGTTPAPVDPAPPNSGATTGSTTGPLGIQWAALPGQIYTGATKWLAPSEAVAVFTDTFKGNSPGLGITIGAALPLLLVAGAVFGSRRRR